MPTQLKLQNLGGTWKVLVFQALEIPYLSNLNQILMMMEVLDSSQQSIMVIHI